MFVNGNPPSTSCTAAFYLDSAVCKSTAAGRRLLTSPFATWDANSSTTLVFTVDAGGVPSIVSCEVFFALGCFVRLTRLPLLNLSPPTARA